MSKKKTKKYMRVDATLEEKYQNIFSQDFKSCKNKCKKYSLIDCRIRITGIR